MGTSKQEVKGVKPSHFSFHMGAVPNPVVSIPHDHTFHFGFPSSVNNIKVSTFSGTPKEHLHRLESVFEKLKEAGLKLGPSKCKFLCQEIRYLGHMISSKGIAVDPDKLECVRNWPVSKTVKEVVGFASFYRRFIKDFAKIACLCTLSQKGVHITRQGQESDIHP